MDYLAGWINQQNRTLNQT